MRQSKEMRKVYSDFLANNVDNSKNIAVLEADLSSSMSTNTLKELFGSRYINVGIMEQEMIGVAAGMSLLGYKPYIHTFGPFASRRVYDQVFVSLGYAKLNATIVGSDAGVSAEMNGGTHMPFEELALMRLIPNAHVYEVSDDVQFEAVLEETLKLEGLKYIRTTRKAPYPIYKGDEDFSKGYSVLQSGKDVAIVASGIMVEQSLKAAEELKKDDINVTVVDVFRIKPLNKDLIELLSGKTVFTAENHNRAGGLGGAICELLSTRVDTSVHRIGVDESFGQVGQMNYLMGIYGLTSEHIVNNIYEVLKNE